MFGITCRKGFYREILTDSCHPCSDCCGDIYKHREAQCENSDLPITQQCRETNLKCQPPSNTSNENSTHQAENSTTHQVQQPTQYQVENPTHPDDPQPKTLLWLISLITVVIIPILVWKLCGFQRVKSILENWCCFCCHSAEKKFYFNEVFDEHAVESSTRRESESYLEKATNKIGFLQSGDYQQF